MKLSSKIRRILWKIMGIEYNHTLSIHDYIFLKNDPFCTYGTRTYDNGAMVWRWTESPIKIGKYCSIANNVRFIADEGFHTTSPITNFPLAINFSKNKPTANNRINVQELMSRFEQKNGIVVGNDVWIGMNSIILPGTTIGDGVTVAANSIVTKDIPDYCIVGGNPAKIIKYKYDQAQIDALKKIKWWDWSEELIEERMDDFYRDFETFIGKYTP